MSESTKAEQRADKWLREIWEPSHRAGRLWDDKEMLVAFAASETIAAETRIKELEQQIVDEHVPER